MKKTAIGLSLVIVGALFAIGCATASGVYHGGIMKGSVVSATGSEGVICIGSKDGAQVGQTLRTTKVSIQGTGKTSKYLWSDAGSVKINEIIDEHFAKVSVVSGKLETGNVVELETK